MTSMSMKGSDWDFDAMLTGLQRTRFGEDQEANPEDLTYLGAVIYHVLNALPPNSHEIDELQVFSS